MMEIDLTVREKEVGSCLISGMTVKQISRKLSISMHTVEQHKRKIKRKLHGGTPYQIGNILGKILED